MMMVVVLVQTMICLKPRSFRSGHSFAKWPFLVAVVACDIPSIPRPRPVIRRLGLGLGCDELHLVGLHHLVGWRGRRWAGHHWPGWALRAPWSLEILVGALHGGDKCHSLEEGVEVVLVRHSTCEGGKELTALSSLAQSSLERDSVCWLEEQPSWVFEHA